MLQYKAGRFHKDGMAFAIPDGFLLDVTYDFTFEGLALWSPDKTVFVEVGFDTNRKDPRKDLENYFEPGTDSDLQIRGSLKQVEVNGLAGFRAWYISIGSSFIEYRLGLPAGGLLWLTFKQEGVSVEQLLQSEHLRAVLEGVRVESTQM